MFRLIAYIWVRFFAEPLRKVEADSLAYRLSDAGKHTDWKTIIVLVTAAATLILQQYTQSPGRVASVVTFVVQRLSGPEDAAAVQAALHRWGSDNLTSHLWWATIMIVTYTVIPILVLKFALRGHLSDHGLKLRGVLNSWPLYVFFVAVMVPLVIIFSGEERFQHQYPFVQFHTKEQVRADQWKWELAYALQFVALEFFFRGFLVHGTKHRFGVYAVFVSMVPYVQIHFQKPMPEATASLIAGIVLGYMSLVTRSVWLGAALHIGVAWGMDFACLYRRGLIEL